MKLWKRSDDQTKSTHEIAAVDAAWRIHQAQADWTSKVDAKAAFAFTIESAAVTVALALAASGRLFKSDLPSWQGALFWLGLLLLLIGAGLAALVVTPRLRAHAVEREASSNFIYFGHARLWSPDALADALGSTSLLPQLSRQIVHMAEIAWVKHIRVQWSFRLGVLGAFVLFVFTCAVAY